MQQRKSTLAYFTWSTDHIISSDSGNTSFSDTALTSPMTTLLTHTSYCTGKQQLQ